MGTISSVYRVSDDELQDISLVAPQYLRGICLGLAQQSFGLPITDPGTAESSELAMDLLASTSVGFTQPDGDGIIIFYLTSTHPLLNDDLTSQLLQDDQLLGMYGQRISETNPK